MDALRPGVIAKLDDGPLRVVMSSPIPTRKPCGCLTDADRYIVETDRLKPMLAPKKGVITLHASQYSAAENLEHVFVAYDPNGNPIAVLSSHPNANSDDATVTLGWYIGTMPHRKILRSDTSSIPGIFKALTPEIIPDEYWAKKGFGLLRQEYVGKPKELHPEDLVPGAPVWFVEKAIQFWVDNRNGRWRVVQEIKDLSEDAATDRRIVIFTDGGKRLLKEMNTYWTCFDAVPETPGYPEERNE